MYQQCQWRQNSLQDKGKQGNSRHLETLVSAAQGYSQTDDDDLERLKMWSLTADWILANISPVSPAGNWAAEFPAGVYMVGAPHC